MVFPACWITLESGLRTTDYIFFYILRLVDGQVDQNGDLQL